ncbi:NAD(P)H-binding protein [Fulvivirga maritima]|uniref:NAD(P)H-binding protein n=1 Tax=Fulvivirga maritima TaxID=2904247 RepID=UPI002795380F|nr:NAD(P)H-binding protein [Fulvivirga maritima]
MKILLTGATGYIGRRLLPILVNDGHQVVCMVRDQRRFDWDDFDDDFLSHVEVMEADLSNPESLAKIPNDIDIAYYLVHSMTSSYSDFSQKEKETAINFAQAIKDTNTRQIIYLSGITNAEDLSEHLKSRKM